MVKQFIPTGSTVIVNAPKAVGIHGQKAHVRSFNPAGVDESGNTVGTYDVMVEGQNYPSWLFPSEMKVVSRAPEPVSDSLRNEALSYIVSLLAEAQADVKDTTAILAQQKERVKTLTKLADLMGD